MTGIPNEPSNTLFKTLDRVLRGEHIRTEHLATGQIDVPLARFARLALLLGGIYGVCLGTFTLFRGGESAGLQIVAATAKVPLLFLLTLAVTFPSLYVFSALQRLPLDIGNTLRLMMLTIVVHLAVIASLGPVFSFFAASTDSYAFMKLLNIGFFAIGGLLGFTVLRAATRKMFAAQLASAASPDDDREAPTTGATDPAEAPPAQDPAPPEPIPPGTNLPPLRVPQPRRQTRPSEHVRADQVLRVWCFVYAIVGAQMGWLLRPFLGSPDLTFSWFRDREGNIFTGIIETIAELFGA